VRASVWALALGLLVALALAPAASPAPLLTLRPDGETFVHDDPHLPPDLAWPRPAAASARGARGAGARGAAVRLEEPRWPGRRVLNTFTQALNGLHDFALLADGAEGARSMRRATRSLRSDLPVYDTGRGRATPTSARPTERPHAGARLPAQPLHVVDGDERGGVGIAPYCQTAQRFTTYVSQPPALRLVSSVARARAGRRR
jgi:hypothetical protein